MPKLKITSYNAEWMTKLFDGTKTKFYIGPSLKGGPGAKPKNCQAVAQKIANVIKGVDSHIVGILEGPPRKAQMQLFVKEYLDDEYQVCSMQNGSQSVHVLVRNDCPVTVGQIEETHAVYKHLAKKVTYYHWDEVKQATMEKFTRKPVVLALTIDDKTYELMTFHTKSKISKLKKKAQYTQRDKTAIVDALRSRQKLSAEMAAIRRYVTHAILSERVDGCIVMGDLNDGPHRDVFEEHFLIHNIVDELRGGFNREKALMHHALRQEFLDGTKAFTAEFSDPTQDGKEVKVMLDHILMTTDIYKGETELSLTMGQGIIEHAVYEGELVNNGKKRDDRPSDHRPISACLSF